MIPGATALTVTPRLATSSDSDFVARAARLSPPRS
jgi:hypothetical protein